MPIITVLIINMTVSAVIPPSSRVRSLRVATKLPGPPLLTCLLFFSKKILFAFVIRIGFVYANCLEHRFQTVKKLL